MAIPYGRRLILSPEILSPGTFVYHNRFVGNLGIIKAINHDNAFGILDFILPYLRYYCGNDTSRTKDSRLCGTSSEALGELGHER